MTSDMNRRQFQSALGWGAASIALAELGLSRPARAEENFTLASTGATWGEGLRVFKLVSFYLLRYESGAIDDIAEEMRVEVGRAKWLLLSDAAQLLAYGGEKQMARRALEYIEAHAEM